MKKRNNNATCGTCPWMWTYIDKSYGFDSTKHFCRNMAHEIRPTAPACPAHPDFWAMETKSANISITYADGHTECVAAEPPTLDDVHEFYPPDTPTLDDVLAAYRRASMIANKYESDMCEECKWDDPKVCKTCAIWWEVKFQPKESAQ